MAEINQKDLLEIGNRIVSRRTELGMTATELSIQADISARTLSQIESGQRETKTGTLIAIAEALGVSLDYLQPQKLDQYAAIPQELSALLPKLNAKSPEAQKKILQILASTIDII